jgi:hypothetical protein
MKTKDFFAKFLISDEPNIKLRQLVELFLVVMLSSVKYEHLFIAMNLTKNKMRTRMLSDLLNDLMMIKLNDPMCHGKDQESPFEAESLTYLIDRAYEMWEQRKVCCVKQSHTQPELESKPYARKKQTTIMEFVELERATADSESSKGKVKMGNTDLVQEQFWILCTPLPLGEFWWFQKAHDEAFEQCD